jgi:hypothetical protein
MSVDNASVRFTTQAITRAFTNNVAVLNFGHNDRFGTRLTVSAQLDLSRLNTASLMFYVFDPVANTLSLIRTEYTVDENGFVHFTTPVGMNIVVTDRPMTARARRR